MPSSSTLSISTSRRRSPRWRTTANIPIASYNDLITGADQDAYIGRDAREGGQIAAKAILAKVPKGNYALIGGDPGQTGATDMQAGYHDVIDPRSPRATSRS